MGFSLSRHTDKFEKEKDRASDKLEHITGFSIEEIGAGLVTGGGAFLAPGALSSLSSNSLAGITTGKESLSIDSLVSGVTSGDIDPRELAIAYGISEEENIEAFIKDPAGAIDAAEKAARAAEAANESAIGQMEYQRGQLEETYAPYYDKAVEEGLPQLQNMIMGGDVDYTPSKLYDYQKETGTRNIRRQQASKGQLKSSATEGKLAGFYSDLAAEEAERAYGGAMSQVQIGSGATNAIASATGTIAGNVDSLYARAGQQQQAAINTAAGSRQSLYAGLANTMQGLSQYIQVGS